MIHFAMHEEARMGYRLFPTHLRGRLALCGVVGIASLAAGALLYSTLGAKNADASSAPPATPPPPPDVSATVKLTDAQMRSITVAPVGERQFVVEQQALGSIDFNENLQVQVFSPYQGRLLQLFADLGDAVVKGQALFTLESPDYIQAEANLIAAAGVLDLTNSALTRAKQLYSTQGISQNDYEQALSDQQTAEGALKAARDAVAVFGKTEAEIDRIVAKRQVENALIVRSPITGRVTARNAAPGLLEQPGNPPAPYSVADTSTVWLLANVTETESPLYAVGQEVQATVAAYPNRVFKGSISAVGAMVDPNTHRVTLRSEIKDPAHELRPGMFANFAIRTSAPITAPAVPLNSVVREGGGTMSVWVTTDRRAFTRRVVKIGLQQDHFDQIIDGIRAGELVAVDGAIFLSNIAFGGAS
jgi:cobalt-zinc-cadmium efflux system membrane fusion protein